MKEYIFNSIILRNTMTETKGDQSINEKIELRKKDLETLEKEYIEDYQNIVKTYNEIGEMYFSQFDYNNALDYFNEVSKYENKLENWDDKITIKVNIGKTLGRMNRFVEAIKYYEEAEKLTLDNIQDTEKKNIILSKIYQGLGLSNGYIGEIEKAENYLNRVAEFFNKPCLPLAENYIAHGVLMMFIGQKERAIEYFNDSIDILNEIGDNENKGRVYINLSALYIDLRDYYKGLEYADMSIQINTQFKHPHRIALSYLNGADAFARLNRSEEAIEYCKKAEEIIEELNDNYLMANLRHMYGLAYKIDENYDNAIKSLNEAVNLFSELNMPSYKGIVYFDIAKIERLRDNLDLAEEFAFKAEDIFIELDSEKHLKNVQKFLKLMGINEE